MPELSAEGCAARRRRLMHKLEELELDAALITDYRDIYYFTGVLVPADLPAAWLRDLSEREIFVAPAGQCLGGRDGAIEYEWNYRGTRHPDVVENMSSALRGVLSDTRYKSIGVQHRSLLASSAKELVRGWPRGTTTPIDDVIAEMQRRKDEDEIAVVCASIKANLGAYEAVRTAIRPGAIELDILAAGYRGAMQVAKEKVFHDGDYHCGQYNGPARNRAIEAGELYIVDAWTCYRGYWSDLSRTFLVGDQPTDEQRSLFEHIRRVQLEAPRMLKPGIDGTEVFRFLDEMIREHPSLSDEGLIHHGGHAIGLRSHEMPDINRNRGGLLEPGQVICLEPGGYFPAARYGVRLENMYLITETGCEDLCPGEVSLFECA